MATKSEISAESVKQRSSRTKRNTSHRCGHRAKSTATGYKVSYRKDSSTVYMEKKNELREAYESNGNKSRNHLRYRNYLNDVGEVTWRRFETARAKRLPVSGPIIPEQAKEFDKLLQKTDYKGSKGWLTRSKGRHSIWGREFFGET